ncbi:MAG: glycoside hydrolase family 97 N-terminal domain-containing protein, partial [Gemmatimonadaceae bacterium]
MRIRSWVRRLTLGITYTTLATAATAVAAAQEQLRVSSPDGRNEVALEVREGRLFYSLRRDGWPILLPSMLGMEFQGARPL